MAGVGIDGISVRLKGEIEDMIGLPIGDDAMAKPSFSGGISIYIESVYPENPDANHMSYIEIDDQGDVYLKKYCSDSIVVPERSMFSGCNRPHHKGEPCIDNELVGSIGEYEVKEMRKWVSLDILIDPFTFMFTGQIPTDIESFTMTSIQYIATNQYLVDAIESKILGPSRFRNVLRR